MQLTNEEQFALDSGHDGGHAVILADVVRRLQAEVKQLRDDNSLLKDEVQQLEWERTEPREAAGGE